MRLKHFSLVVGAVLALTVLTGCPDRRENTLVVWSFTNEIERMIEMFDVEAAIGMEIDYTLIPSDQFTDRLDPALLAGVRVAPDVFALESAFVRAYIESGLLLDLTELYEAVRNSVIRYPVEIATHNGRVYGMSWQAAPGAMFFRRSIARELLGTDDPAVVQTYFDNWYLFLETAQRMSDDSGGRVVVVSAVDDLGFPFYASRDRPWVVDGELYVDPVLLDYMRIARTLRDNGLDGRAMQWSESWFAGMRGELADELGNRIDVFSYFLPTWGLHYVLAEQAPETAGDWAMIPGPASWFWGGTWLVAYRDTRHPEVAKEFIRLLTTNEDNLYRWATETGDFVNNLNVINRILETGTPNAFLGGQDHYAEFAAMAPYIDGSIIQGTDQTIQSLFLEAVNQYVHAESTMEEALDMFRAQVRALLGF